MKYRLNEQMADVMGLDGGVVTASQYLPGQPLNLVFVDGDVSYVHSEHAEPIFIRHGEWCIAQGNKVRVLTDGMFQENSTPIEGESGEKPVEDDAIVAAWKVLEAARGNTTVIATAQVMATLAQAEQMKRIADLMEKRADVARRDFDMLKSMRRK